MQDCSPSFIGKSAVQIKGKMEMPSKVHLIYFDSMEGLQKIATDQRMNEHYPIRDALLKDTNLILDKAIKQ